MVIKPFINLKNLRSAVAFFFLFFLHGTSIGTRQQGISYNVLRLGEVGELYPLKPIRITNVQ